MDTGEGGDKQLVGRVRINECETSKRDSVKLQSTQFSRMLPNRSLNSFSASKRPYIRLFETS
jgi:hypothetical protein